MRPRHGLLAVGALIVGVAIPWISDDYAVGALTVSFYYVILAITWNLLAGYAGQYSLATQAFATLGGYGSGLAIKYFHVPMWLGVTTGITMAVVCGAALGALVLRLRSAYLALATWGFAATVQVTLAAAYGFTGGQLGLSVPTLFGSLNVLPYYYLFLGLAVATILISYIMVNSRIGLIWRAIRDSETRIQSLGVDTTAWKVFAFAVCSGLAGMAGAFYAHYLAIISPDRADFSEMALIIVMVIIGGMGRFSGPILGALLVSLIASYTRRYGELNYAFFALAVIVLMRTYRAGLVALLVQAAERVRRQLMAWRPRAGTP